MAFIAAVAPALSAIGAVAGAAGTVFSGIATANAADYQAQVANNNAIIAQQNADYAEKAGAAQTQQESLKNAATIAGVKTAQAANGVDVNSGSNLDVQESQREVGQLDTETTNNNALLAAYGYKTQSTNFQAQAGLEEQEAAAAPIGAGLSAAGGLLGNASALSLKWNSPTVSSTTSYPTISSDQP